MQVFTLFETDAWKSKSSRLFLGVFSSYENALQGWRDESPVNDNDFVIIETPLDEAGEA